MLIKHANNMGHLTCILCTLPLLYSLLQSSFFSSARIIVRKEKMNWRRIIGKSIKKKVVMKTENGSHFPESNLIKKRGWRQSFTILAAMLCVIVVVGSFFLYTHYSNSSAS